MSTATEIARLTEARNEIRDKLIDLGLATSTSKLDDLSAAVNGIVNRGAISAQVEEGETYSIPAGYHNGSGTVSGVAGGGNYSLQSKSITPTKSQQSVTPDSGYYGLSDVTVNAIPEAYQNVSAVNATAADVLSPKVFVNATGSTITGGMSNQGAVNATLDATTNNQTYTVPAGYHNGSGTVKITLETKSATPTTSSQDITPTSGKVLSKVTVNAIPAKFGDTTGDDAVAANLLSGKTAHTNVSGTATLINGSMPNIGSVNATLDATTDNQSYTIPEGYHDGTGYVEIDLETKSVTPTKSAQDITPTNGSVLSKVTVNAIPAAYQDVTSVNATGADVLSGKVFVNASGSEVTGSMTNRGAVSKTLDATSGNQSYTVPSGYHNGSGTVSITLEEKSATPTTSAQNITPTSGKVLSKVTVNAIPSQYQDVSSVNATGADVLYGKVFVNASGSEITGSMTNRGAINATIDGITTTSYTVAAGYHNGSGTVSLTDDILEALEAI